MVTEDLDLLRKSLRIADIVGDYNWAGEVCIIISKIMFKKGYLRDAMDSLKKAENYFLKKRNIDGVSRVNEARGDIEWGRNFFAKALKWYNIARWTVSEKSPNAYIRIHLKTAEAHLKFKEYNSAIECARAAYNMAIVKDLVADAAKALYLIGKCLLAQKNYKLSWMTLLAAHSMAKKCKDTELITKILEQKRMFKVHFISRRYKYEKVMANAGRRGGARNVMRKNPRSSNIQPDRQ